MSNEKANPSTRKLHCLGLIGITAISLVLEGFTPVNCVCLAAELVWIGVVEGSAANVRIFAKIKFAMQSRG